MESHVFFRRLNLIYILLFFPTLNRQYGEKPGEEITIDSNEVHVIACTLRSVFTSLMNSFGRSVDEEIKEDEEWYNSGHGLIELSKLLPKGEARKNMFENVFRLLIQEEGANNADDPETR